MSLNQLNPTGKGMRVSGIILTGLTTALFLMDGVMKIVKPEPVVKATAGLGYPENVISGIGIALVICVVLYVVPRTSILGAILLTGYLGGAVASHVRAGNGWGQIVMPVIFGALVWAGPFLRDARLRALVPLKMKPQP
jgi:hypothetical protein